MTISANGGVKPSPRRRLSSAERRRQLLETAILIVQQEGADRLTLGQLALRAGVSKPVVYDHFESRSALLIDLYRWIDMERVEAFREAMATGDRSASEAVGVLAATYIACAADTNGEFHAVGGALAGSEEMDKVFQELLENCVQMFVSVLRPYSALASAELERRCVALVGAGEALAGMLIRKRSSEREAVEAFAAIIHGALVSPSPT